MSIFVQGHIWNLVAEVLGQGVPKKLKVGPCHSLIKGALDDLVQVPILHSSICEMEASNCPLGYLEGSLKGGAQSKPSGIAELTLKPCDLRQIPSAT